MLNHYLFLIINHNYFTSLFIFINFLFISILILLIKKQDLLYNLPIYYLPFIQIFFKDLQFFINSFKQNYVQKYFKGLVKYFCLNFIHFKKFLKF